MPNQITKQKAYNSFPKKLWPGDSSHQLNRVIKMSELCKYFAKEVKQYTFYGQLTNFQLVTPLCEHKDQRTTKEKVILQKVNSRLRIKYCISFFLFFFQISFLLLWGSLTNIYLNYSLVMKCSTSCLQFPTTTNQFNNQGVFCFKIS